MKQFYKLSLIFTVIFSSLLSSCGSDDDSSTSNTNGNPDTHLGSISGTITPTNAAANIVLTSPLETRNISPDLNGNYKFENLDPGPYTLYANPTPGYQPSEIIEVTVISNENTTVELITMQPEDSQQTASISFVMDDIYYSIPISYIGGYYSMPNFSISGATGSGNSNYYTIGISLDNVNGVGTYYADNYPSRSIKIFEYNNGSWLYGWSNRFGEDGIINITSLNPVTRRASGTFSIVAPSENNLTNTTKTITEGVFTNVYLE